MQHHPSSGVRGVTEFEAIISSVEGPSSCPAAFANMIWHSASLWLCDFTHDAHFLTTFVSHSIHMVMNLCQMDLCSCRTTLIPFGFPLSFRSGWSSEKHIVCTWVHVSSLSDTGSILLSRITVLCSFLCFYAGCIFILWTLRAFSAKPLCADEWSKTKITIQSECVCSKILIGCLTWTISWERSHHTLKPFLR